MGEETARPDGGSLPKDLAPRIVSGFVLAIAAVAFAYAGARPFAALVLAIGVLMSWEWGRIVRGAGVDATLIVHALAVTVAIVLTGLGLAALALVALLIGMIIVAFLRFGEKARLSAVGVAYVGLPAVSLLWLRSDEPYGFLAVVFVFLAVWTTDTAAYVAGRLIGGPKLWPRLSPNKTWTGLAGGVAASAAAGAVFALILAHNAIPSLVLGALALGILSQAGDLLESGLKRGFGVKDASALIPGHGGFLDRIDGLVVAATGAAIFAMIMNIHAPAGALLFWL